MPVSKISVLVERSVTGGASRWIGQWSSAVMGPPPSMTSPTRLKTRPSVALPTGTLTGEPVSRQSMPRTMPSVLAQGDAADLAAAEVLLHFAGQVHADVLELGGDADGVVDGRHLMLGELGVEGRADDLRDLADVMDRSPSVCCCGFVLAIEDLSFRCNECKLQNEKCKMPRALRRTASFPSSSRSASELAMILHNCVHSSSKSASFFCREQAALDDQANPKPRLPQFFQADAELVEEVGAAFGCAALLVVRARRTFPIVSIARRRGAPIASPAGR